ncbi:MAG: hypothetical protein ACI9FD_004283 [Gammaproteobacteria bacterium]|jgi:hypothetical protein
MQQQLNPPSKQELRQFGLMFGGFISIIFGLLLPFIFSGSYRLWPWIVGALFVAWALILPGSLRLVFKLWLKIGFVLNYVNTRLILGVIFFALFLPFALVLRLFGWDAMHRKFSKVQSSYRIVCKPTRDGHMKFPY